MQRNALLLFFWVVLSGYHTPIRAKFRVSKNSVGLFSAHHATLEGIRFGNWGSRPYEYYWASTIVDVRGKKVIDLGMGIPSQYNWYEYVVNTLHPALYVGIDYDGRMLNEQISTEQYELKFMNMVKIKYPDNHFDVAYAINTFQSIPHQTLMKAMAEIHRVLADDGLLVVTMDEKWDCTQALCHSNSWNFLEQDLEKRGLFKADTRSFGLPEFLMLIQNYFELWQEDLQVNTQTGEIVSNTTHRTLYRRKNKDDRLINSALPTNSCVSFAVLKKVHKNSEQKKENNETSVL